VIDRAVQTLNPIPASWYAAAVPLPLDEDLAGFMTRLVCHLSPNWRRLWTWAPGQVGTREVILATPDAGTTVSLMAQVLTLPDKTA
jgi:hypothetical protein